MRHPIPLNPGGSPHPGKRRRAFLEPLAFPKDNPAFEAPPPTNNTNLVLPLSIISPQAAAGAADAGRIVFHMVGDTGGFNGVEAQVAVAEAMEAQIKVAEDNRSSAPAFFFHLGDVIYYDGQAGFYEWQFYDPYKHYPREIFAIPGNHDGDIRMKYKGDPPPDGPSLAGFMGNFCDGRRRSVFAYRSTVTQPYCYWRLEAPFVNIVGLYSNIEGTLDARGGYEQQQWFEQQLRNTPEDRFLVVAVHHPPYSLDQAHGGTPDIASAIDRAMYNSGRIPHAIVSAHVHSYQRFERVLPADLGGGTLPYIVAGAGGFANTPKALHKLQVGPEGQEPAPGTRAVSNVDPTLDLTFRAANDASSSFLRVTADAAELRFEAFAVEFDGHFGADPFDTVTVPRDGASPPRKQPAPAAQP